MHVAHSLMLVGNLPGYQSMVRKNCLLTLLFAWWYFSLAQSTSNVVKSDPGADTSITLGALAAGMHFKAAGTPGGPESYVGSE